MIRLRCTNTGYKNSSTRYWCQDGITTREIQDRQSTNRNHRHWESRPPSGLPNWRTGPTIPVSVAHIGSFLVEMKEEIPVRIVNPTTRTMALPIGTNLGNLADTDKAEGSSQPIINYSDCEEIPDNDYISKFKHLAQSKHGRLPRRNCKGRTAYGMFYSDKLPDKHWRYSAHSTTSTAYTLGFQRAEIQHLTHLLESDIVVLSQSDLTVPVVLVRKNDAEAG